MKGVDKPLENEIADAVDNCTTWPLARHDIRDIKIGVRRRNLVNVSRPLYRAISQALPDLP